MRNITIILVLILLSSCASKFEKSFVEYKRKNIERAVNICAGDESYGCRFVNGIGYYLGKGFERDVKRGIKLIKEASDNGISEAQAELGIIYLNGFGVPQDFSRGLELFHKAAKKGNALALHNLGIIYSEGKFVERDYKKALNFCIESFNGGRVDAAVMAGRILSSQRRNDEAVKWLKKGAERGSVECEYTLGLFFESVKNYHNLKKSFFWYKRAAEKGDIRAAYKLGVFYYYGRGTSVDKKESKKWFLFSARKNYAKAQYSLGLYYQIKEFRDYNKSNFWFKKAAENGHIQALRQIGFHFLNGHGVNKDKDKAFRFFKLSSDKGDLEAFFLVGRCYELGIGVKKDLKKAFNIFSSAADKGHKESIKRVVASYLHGTFGVKNCNKALSSLRYYSKFGPKYIADMGFLLFFDKNCKADKKRSVKYFIEAAGKGEIRAQEFLAALYYDGKVVKKDLIEAYAWINIALSKNRNKKSIKLRNSIEAAVSIDQVRKAQIRTRELIKKYNL